MLILRRLASVLVVSSGLTLAACGGGGAFIAASSAMSVSEDGSDGAEPQCGREGIPRAGAPAMSEAYVEIERRMGAEPEDRFRVEVTGLPIGTVVDVWLEAPDAPDVYALVGTLSIGDGHDGVLQRSTNVGDLLPYGVLTVTRLVGLGLELRSPTGLVLFAGTVPALDAR